MERQLRIVYMGTPEFAVAPLRAILEAGYPVVAVVTAPDKPAGRGRNLRPSAVKEFALEHGLKILQPVSLKDPDFIEELRSCDANLQVVVAFRMLPEKVWEMPEYGTFNLHASLLPQYRGAAPINRAIMNGETETGITTFFLTHEIDTGNILFREKYPIYPVDDAGALHDRLMTAGAGLVIRTIAAVRRADYSLYGQESLVEAETELKGAPKIFREDCEINWNLSGNEIHNQVRGLSPFPGAFGKLISGEGTAYTLKIFRTVFQHGDSTGENGSLLTDGKTFLSVRVADGILNLLEVQMEGKKRLTTPEFLRGFTVKEGWWMR